MKSRMATCSLKKKKVSAPTDDDMEKEYEKIKATLKASVDAKVQSACVVEDSSGKTVNRTHSSYTGSQDSEDIASRIRKFSYHPELRDQILEGMKRY